MHKLLWKFEIQTDHLISTRPRDSQEKNLSKNKSEKKDKYQDFERTTKNLWNMKVTVIPIVIGVWEQSPKD